MIEGITVVEATRLKYELNDAISALISKFQADTGTVVVGINVRDDDDGDDNSPNAIATVLVALPSGIVE